VGATYTRWGKSTCQSNGTELVYSGLSAGSYYTHGGAAVNNHCLTKSPLWNKFENNEQAGLLFTAQSMNLTLETDNTSLEVTLQTKIRRVPCAERVDLAS